MKKMKINYLNLKGVLYFVFIYITIVYADNIRIHKFLWEKIDVVSNVGDDLPEERRDFAIGYDPDKDDIIIYGGRTVDNRVLSDTWLFNVNQRVWRKPTYVQKETDIHPPGRYGMVYGNDQPSSNSFRNTFVITNGKGSDGTIYNDVWSFDFIREAWVEIKATGDIPEARYDAIGGIDSTKMSYLNQLPTEYLILSHGKNDSKYFTDTYILKLDGRSQQGDYSQLTAEWIKVNTKHAPELKDGATGSILSGDRLVAFGGCEENKGNCNDKGYYLDINFDYNRITVEQDVSWKEINNKCVRPKGYAASARGSNPSTTINLETDLENDRLIIFGGINEKRYGSDANGEISIIDMDKGKFYGVQPESKNKEIPKATKGAKMISISPKNANSSGFSIILYGGEPIGNEEWSSNIWKLNVLDDYSYYPTPPAGVTLTNCYSIQTDVVEEENNFGDSSTPKSNSESTTSIILFILTLLAIPALVIISRALNCFTDKWKVIFLSIGALCIVLTIFTLSLSINFSNIILIMKIITLCFLLIYLSFPFLRPNQPDLDINQDVVNAAGVPVANIEGKNKNNLKSSSSSSLLIDASMKNNANIVASEINVDNESAPPTPKNRLRKLTIDSKYSDAKDGNRSEKRDSFLSPIFINPSIKKDVGESDEAEDIDETEIEDEDEVIKNKYLSRANLWLNMLRATGVVILISLITLALLIVYSEQSVLYNKKFIIYAWIILIIILYIVAVIIARKKHSSMALLRAKRISFRPSEPLEPNHINSWALPADQMKRFSLVSESSYGKTSAYDDIGNVSNYSQSVRNYNNINAAQSTTTNAPVINGNNSNVSPSLGYSIPPLPVTPVYMNNNGLFSIQSNYKYQNPNPNLTPASSSVMNQTIEPGIYKASEVTNIPASTSDYQSLKDVDLNSGGLGQIQVVNNNNTGSINNLVVINNANNNLNEKYSSSSSLNSLAMKEERNNAGLGMIPSYQATTSNNGLTPLIITNNGNGSVMTNSNVTIPSPQSQVQLLPNPNINSYGIQPSSTSSPILKESPIQINTVDDQEGSLDFPQRNNTIENMNDKEVMMVMTVPKRKLAVVNM